MVVWRRNIAAVARSTRTNETTPKFVLTNGSAFQKCRAFVSQDGASTGQTQSLRKKDLLLILGQELESLYLVLSTEYMYVFVYWYLFVLFSALFLGCFIFVPESHPRPPPPPLPPAPAPPFPTS